MRRLRELSGDQQRAGIAAAATAMNAAEEMSPGTVSVQAVRRWPPWITMRRPALCAAGGESSASVAPNAVSARSV